MSEGRNNIWMQQRWEFAEWVELNVVREEQEWTSAIATAS
jgi:hypothetical protein